MVVRVAAQSSRLNNPIRSHDLNTGKLEKATELTFNPSYATLILQAFAFSPS